MTTIIPIPAFRDNYIWAVRNGANAAVVDPGDAAPVLACLDANDVQLSAIIATHHHADHVGGVADLRAQYDVPVFGPAREAIPRRTHALSRAIASRCRAWTRAVACSTFRATRPGISRTARRATIRCCSAATRCSPPGAAACSKGTPEQMWTSLVKLAALPAATRVYCGHEYTLANLRFAQAVEPDNDDVRARIASERRQARSGRADAAVDDRRRARDQSVSARGGCPA